MTTTLEDLAGMGWSDILIEAWDTSGHYQCWLQGDPVPLSFLGAHFDASCPAWVTLDLEQGVPMDVRLAAIVAVMEVPDAE